MLMPRLETQLLCIKPQLMASRSHSSCPSRTIASTFLCTIAPISAVACTDQNPVVSSRNFNACYNHSQIPARWTRWQNCSSISGHMSVCPPPPNALALVIIL